jgi:alkaline phosphatase D
MTKSIRRGSLRAMLTNRRTSPTNSHMAGTELTRRAFLTSAGASAGAIALAAGSGDLSRAALAQRPRIRGYPFTLGVASGDPLPNGVVLWTRLAPDPLNGGGMPDRPLPVRWQVAEDERFRRVVRRGTATAASHYAHSVHVEVGGLRPGREYWYRFAAGGEFSPPARTRTAPAAGARELSFAVASCQHYEHGWYVAYRDLARQDLDFVLHLGDYIYEDAPRGGVRAHAPFEPQTLAQYRHRYAQYKRDPDLQAAHAAAPFVVTWDDHDVENDYADELDENGTPPDRFLRRRAIAYRAFYEHLPLRRSSLPRGPDMRIYRRLALADLLDLSVLDLRQYRDDQPCAAPGSLGGRVVDCPERLEPARTLAGPAQERWLLRGLGRSRAHWNVIAQPLMMSRFDQVAGPGEGYWSDGWDGYAAARGRILGYIAARRPANPVVLGGDIHCFFVNDLKADFADPASRTLATEFVGTSITSLPGPVDAFERALPDNPHIRFFEGRQRGYALCRVSRSRWRTDLRVADALRRDARANTLASFVVESGRPGAERI